MAAAVVGGAVIVTGRDAIARSHDPALDAIARYHQSEAACDVVGRRLEAVVDVILNDPVARLKYADPGDSDRLAFMKIYGREVRAVQPLNDAYTVIKEARRVVGTVAASTIPGALAKLKLGQKWGHHRHGVSARESAIEDLERFLGEGGVS